MIYTIYSQPQCTACDQAKSLLKGRGLEYVELILNTGQKQEEGKTYVPLTHLKERVPDAKSVPQVFHGKYYIGGLTELRKHLNNSMVKAQ